MSNLQNETNLAYYDDIVLDWLEHIREECNVYGSEILVLERIHIINSIYPTILNIINEHMQFEEELKSEEDNKLLLLLRLSQ